MLHPWTFSGGMPSNKKQKGGELEALMYMINMSVFKSSVCQNWVEVYAFQMNFIHCRETSDNALLCSHQLKPIERSLINLLHVPVAGNPGLRWTQKFGTLGNFSVPYPETGMAAWKLLRRSWKACRVQRTKHVGPPSRDNTTLDDLFVPRRLSEERGAGRINCCLFLKQKVWRFSPYQTYYCSCFSL